MKVYFILLWLILWAAFFGVLAPLLVSHRSYEGPIVAVIAFVLLCHLSYKPFKAIFFSYNRGN